MYSYYNPNPRSRSVGDCVVRGISKATGKDWDTVFLELAIEGYTEKDMPSANAVWGKYLRRLGYRRAVIPDSGEESCTVAPNCSVQLMDSETPVFYIKAADASGMPLPLRTFDYTERLQGAVRPPDGRETQGTDYVTREEFNALAARFAALAAKKEENENG